MPDALLNTAMPARCGKMGEALIDNGLLTALPMGSLSVTGWQAHRLTPPPNLCSITEQLRWQTGVGVSGVNGGLHVCTTRCISLAPC